MKETLKALREQFNYSQNTVANFLGISRQMYIKYENGDVEPPVKIIVALCGLYKVPYDYLIENKGTVHTENNSENKKVIYNRHNLSEPEPLVIADPRADYSPSYNSTHNYDIEQNYSQTVVNMFSKLTFIKQLAVFAELAGIIQKQSKEEAEMKLETKKEMTPLERLMESFDKHPGDSKGWQWNREELYDR